MWPNVASVTALEPASIAVGAAKHRTKSYVQIAYIAPREAMANAPTAKGEVLSKNEA